MSSLTTTDKIKLEKILESSSGPGYILDFSNRTFRDFIFSTTGKDIDVIGYGFNGSSKANRLRSFWDKESDIIVGKLISGMLEYWKTKRVVNSVPITVSEQSLYEDCLNIAARLLGNQNSVKVSSEEEFIQKDFHDISLAKINLDSSIIPVLEQRLEEIKKCLKAKASLAAIFLCGSTLEGLLLGIATKHPKDFNMSVSSPKDKDGKPLPFHCWSLADFIDVSYSLNLLDEDVKKFSHVLRDFRNYIHPFQQMSSRFNPTEHTAQICWKVLQAAIYQVSK